MRRQRDAHETPLACRDDPLDRVANVGMPVTHADVHGKAVPEQLLDGSRLRLGDPADRRAAAHPGGPLPHLPRELGAHLPAAANLEQIRLRLLPALLRPRLPEPHHPFFPPYAPAPSP